MTGSRRHVPEPEVPRPEVSRPGVVGPSPARDLPGVMELVRDVEGWMTAGQASALFEAARRCPRPGRIVEIGSFRGKSTIVLASGAPDGVEVVAIDPHAGNDRGPGELDGYAAEADADHVRFLANLDGAGVAERVRHVRQFSDSAHAAVDGEIDVLYVDGAHRYRPARADLRGWGCRVGDGGSLLIHDAFSSVGVTLAIFRELGVGGRFRYVGRSRSLAIYRADLRSGVGARSRNLGRQAAQLPWFVRNVGLKVLLASGLGRLWTLTGRRPPEWPY